MLNASLPSEGEKNEDAGSYIGDQQVSSVGGSGVRHLRNALPVEADPEEAVMYNIDGAEWHDWNKEVTPEVTAGEHIVHFEDRGKEGKPGVMFWIAETYPDWLNKELVEVIDDDTVKIVGGSAFKGCGNLVAISVNGGKIPDHAVDMFKDCIKLDPDISGWDFTENLQAKGMFDNTAIKESTLFRVLKKMKADKNDAITLEKPQYIGIEGLEVTDPELIALIEEMAATGQIVEPFQANPEELNTSHKFLANREVTENDMPTMSVINLEVEGPETHADGSQVWAVSADFNWDNANGKSLEWVHTLQSIGTNNITGKDKQVASGRKAFQGLSANNAETRKAIQTLDVSNLEVTPGGFDSMFKDCPENLIDFLSWDVGASDLEYMFAYSEVNPSLDAFDMSRASNYRYMFRRNSKFNQPLPKNIWNEHLDPYLYGSMFQEAKEFNQDLSDICLVFCKSKPDNFDSSATDWKLPRPSYGTCSPNKSKMAHFVSTKQISSFNELPGKNRRLQFSDAVIQETRPDGNWDVYALLDLLLGSSSQQLQHIIEWNSLGVGVTYPRKGGQDYLYKNMSWKTSPVADAHNYRFDNAGFNAPPMYMFQGTPYEGDFSDFAKLTQKFDVELRTIFHGDPTTKIGPNPTGIDNIKSMGQVNYVFKDNDIVASPSVENWQFPVAVMAGEVSVNCANINIDMKSWCIAKGAQHQRSWVDDCPKQDPEGYPCIENDQAGNPIPDDECGCPKPPEKDVDSFDPADWEAEQHVWEALYSGDGKLAFVWTEEEVKHRLAADGPVKKFEKKYMGDGKWLYGAVFDFKRGTNEWYSSAAAINIFHQFGLNSETGKVNQISDGVSKQFNYMKLTEPGALPNLDTSNITTMNSWFRNFGHYGGTELPDLSKWDTSSVNDMYGMFMYAKKINQDLSGWCVSNLSSYPRDFHTGVDGWTEPLPVWGTCP